MSRRKRRKFGPEDQLTSTQKINALDWASKKRGVSYGQLNATLTEEEANEIYEMYRIILLQKQEERKDFLQRIRCLKENEVNTGGI